jgi:hypothetical protein
MRGATVTISELKRQIGDAIGGYFDGVEASDPDKCKQIAREALLLAAFMHTAHNGSDDVFLQMAKIALAGAHMASPKQ